MDLRFSEVDLVVASTCGDMEGTQQRQHWAAALPTLATDGPIMREGKKNSN